MTPRIDPTLIDNHTIGFNISAWIGGYQYQDDNAVISLMFLNSLNEQVGINITLGPVLDADRGSITSLLFRQRNGLVPIGSRSFRVTVTMTHVLGEYSDGSVDNIVINFYP